MAGDSEFLKIIHDTAARARGGYLTGVRRT
jgi:hypothetical protein